MHSSYSSTSWLLPLWSLGIGVQSYALCGPLVACKSTEHITPPTHDRIRDLEASILRDICKDVRVEPDLLPVGNSTVGSSTTGEKSRLDVSAVGIWSPMERTFMDVKIVHPNAPSHKNKDLNQIFKESETKKKHKYNQRVMQVEKATFTPPNFLDYGWNGL